MKKIITYCLMFLFFCLGIRTVSAEEATPIQVAPLSDLELEQGLSYGARVVIPAGTKYYASADFGGSGPSGTIGNKHTPMGTDLYIGGFATMRSGDRLNEFEAYNPQLVPVSTSFQPSNNEIAWDGTWVAIYLDPNDDEPIGWLPARSIAIINGIIGDGGSNAKFAGGVEIGSEPTNIPKSIQDPTKKVEAAKIDATLPDPGNAIEDRVIRGQGQGPDKLNDDGDPFITSREIAYAIEDYSDNGEKVALLLDSSGSVATEMADISDYGGYIEKVNKAEVVVTFAQFYKAIKAEDYLSTDVGAFTDIYTPLNQLEDVSSYDRIIIVTDTYHNAGSNSITDHSDFSGEIVIVYCAVDSFGIRQQTVRDIEYAFGKTVHICQLNNELDRIRALEMLDN